MAYNRMKPISQSVLDSMGRKPRAKAHHARMGVQAGAHKPKAYKHPKWVVLEVRRLRETHGMKVAHIQHKLELRGVEISVGDIDRYINYQSRAGLVPVTNRREPYGPADTGEV